jgi:hypothetical protein
MLRAQRCVEAIKGPGKNPKKNSFPRYNDEVIIKLVINVHNKTFISEGLNFSLSSCSTVRVQNPKQWEDEEEGGRPFTYKCVFINQIAGIRSGSGQTDYGHSWKASSA